MATLTVKNVSIITGNTAPDGFGADVYNLGVLYLDSTSNIGIFDGNPWVPIWPPPMAPRAAAAQARTTRRSTGH
jgi:hypothetical protein